MLEFWREGGFAMYPILLFGVAAVALGGLAVASRSRGSALSAIVLGSIVMLLGVAGMMMGRSSTDRALAMVAPADAEQIRVQGYKESNRPLQLAGPLALLGVALGVAGRSLSKQT